MFFIIEIITTIFILIMDIANLIAFIIQLIFGKKGEN